MPAFAARCWSSSHSVRDSWTSSPSRVHHATLEVDLDVVEGQDPRSGRDARGSAQDGPHAGRQLVGVEGLGHVVVGAQVQALGLVRRGALGRQEDDRDGAPLAQLAHDLDAVEVEHHDVQEHDVRPQLLGLLEGFLATTRRDDAKALLAEGRVPRAW